MTSFAPVPGFPGYVACSDGYIIGKRGDILSPHLNNGYAIVGLTVAGITRNVRVHRAVALAFLGEPPEGKGQVAHWDGDPGNNRVDNLRWASALENAQDKLRHGTTLRTLSDQEATTVRWAANNGWSTVELSELYGLPQPMISMIKTGKTYRAMQAAS